MEQGGGAECHICLSSEGGFGVPIGKPLCPETILCFVPKSVLVSLSPSLTPSRRPLIRS